jgi:hypothetical protein
MRAVLLVAALLLVGCEDTYRYPCQDPANKDKAECNRPACEADGMCYDSLNGLPPKAAAEPQVEETPAPVAELNNTEEVTGE